MNGFYANLVSSYNQFGFLVPHMMQVLNMRPAGWQSLSGCYSIISQVRLH